MKSRVSSLAWADFQPSKLRAVRRKVVEEHPTTGEKLRAAPGSDLERLKERLEQAKGNRKALEKIARSLTASELRGLAVQIGPWEELRKPIATVLRFRPRGSVRPHLWSSWQRYPRAPEVRELLDEIAREHGWTRIAEGYEEAAEEWVAAARPSTAIQEWLDGQGLSYSDLPELVDLPLDLESRLVRDVRRAVMTEGSTAQLRTEGGDRLASWYYELSSEEEDPGSDPRKAFGRHYLVTLESRNWEPKILELLGDHYGSPKDGREAFWEQVPQQERSAFHRWFIERNLEEALGSDTDRHRYWVGKSDDLVDVELGKAGRVEYAVLYCENFGVIEFFETGNAAYFYPLEKLEEIHRGGATHPSDLKDRYHPGIGRRGDNRLIHHRNWQRKADRQVRNWKSATR